MLKYTVTGSMLPEAGKAERIGRVAGIYIFFLNMESSEN
jgi:hypothetical protein